VPLIDGQMETRAQPLGFWVHPVGGIRTPSTEILKHMMARQQSNTDTKPAPFAFREPGKITEHYSEDKLLGHSAWIDGTYKLHRIGSKKTGDARYMLFDLATDPKEQDDLAQKQPERLNRMKADLETWQKTVVRSLNGEDYN
jgi:hypothetical protein